MIEDFFSQHVDGSFLGKIADRILGVTPAQMEQRIKAASVSLEKKPLSAKVRKTELATMYAINPDGTTRSI